MSQSRYMFIFSDIYQIITLVSRYKLWLKYYQSNWECNTVHIQMLFTGRFRGTCFIWCLEATWPHRIVWPHTNVHLVCHRCHNVVARQSVATQFAKLLSFSAAAIKNLQPDQVTTRTCFMQKCLSIAWNELTLQQMCNLTLTSIT